MKLLRFAVFICLSMIAIIAFWQLRREGDLDTGLPELTTAPVSPVQRGCEVVKIRILSESRTSLPSSSLQIIRRESALSGASSGTKVTGQRIMSDASGSTEIDVHGCDYLWIRASAESLEGWAEIRPPWPATHTIVLRRTHALIHVVRADSTPVVGAMVVLVAGDESDRFGKCGGLTDEHGLYRMALPHTGEDLTLEVSPPDDSRELVTHRIVNWSGTDVTIALALGWSLHGLIEFSAPITDATRIWWIDESGEQRSLLTRTHGFRLVGLKGPVRLQALASASLSAERSGKWVHVDPRNVPAQVIVSRNPGGSIAVTLSAPMHDREAFLIEGIGRDAILRYSSKALDEQVLFPDVDNNQSYTLWIPPDGAGRYVLCDGLVVRRESQECIVSLGDDVVVVLDQMNVVALMANLRRPAIALVGTPREGEIVFHGVPPGTWTLELLTVGLGNSSRIVKEVASGERVSLAAMLASLSKAPVRGRAR